MRRAEELEAATTGPGFWDDQKSAQETLQELNTIRDKQSRMDKFTTTHQELTELLEMALVEGESEFFAEIENSYVKLIRDVDALELTTLLSGEYDNHSVYLTIHPGAGGTESQDWASMLLRMYTRWAEKNGYKVDLMELLPGDEAGIKSATLHISGPYSYAYLKGEKGVHRLVRISPFDASGRRHTSFASIDVVPEITDDESVELRSEDLKVDTYRSSGAGGQHVNKTESAIRITHVPTGIVVACQNERSQHQNREVAMGMLRAKLAELQRRERAEKMAQIKGEQMEIAWGSQIRSYVFCPYTMVKDHRTEAESGNIQAVMDGEIYFLMESYLRSPYNIG
jgi:peptide chain release factor 2